MAERRPVRSRHQQFCPGVAPMAFADKVLVGFYFFVVSMAIVMIASHRVPPHNCEVSPDSRTRSRGYREHHAKGNNRISVGIVVPPSTVATVVEWLGRNPLFPLADIKDVTVVSDIHTILCGASHLDFDIGIFVAPADPMARFYRHVMSSLSATSLETVLKDIDRDLECVQRWDRRGGANPSVNITVCKDTYCSIRRRLLRPHFLLWGMHRALAQEFNRTRMPPSSTFIRAEEGTFPQRLVPAIVERVNARSGGSFGNQTGFVRPKDGVRMKTLAYADMAKKLTKMGLPTTLVEGIRDFYSMHR